MFEALFHRGWRSAVGLIAAYALVLQALLAYSIAAQAAASGDVSGSFFVICKTDSDGTTADGAPAKPTTHCPVCTLALDGAGAVPGVAALPLPHAFTVQPTPFVTAQACVSYHRARAGLTRAPPQNV
jgi:hypothetical protein